MPASSLTLIEGTSFVICGGAGDIGDAAVDGVFVGDTRVCDRLVLTVDGERIEALAATAALAVPRRDGWPHRPIRHAGLPRPLGGHLVYVPTFECATSDLSPGG